MKPLILFIITAVMALLERCHNKIIVNAFKRGIEVGRIQVLQENIDRAKVEETKFQQWKRRA